MMRKPKFIIFDRFYWVCCPTKITYFLQCNVPHFNLILVNELKTKTNKQRQQQQNKTRET